MDRLQAMRIFSKVVEQGGFARAATALSLSNTVVTRNVAELEAHLGARLLHRTTRKLSLTEAGRQYLERVRNILAEIDDAEALAASASQKASGTLRIYCYTGFGQAHLSRLLPRFAAQEPDVVLDVTLHDRPVDLVEEGYDVGIFMGLQKIDASMVERRLATSTVILCASPGYLARHGAPAVPADLSAHACLNYNYEVVRHSWAAHVGENWENVPISSRMVSNSSAMLRQACLAGMGIMIRSSCMLEDDFTSGRLVRLLEGHRMGTLSISLAYPSRRMLSYKVRSFINFMSAEFPHPEQDPWLS